MQVAQYSPSPILEAYIKCYIFIAFQPGKIHHQEIFPVGYTSMNFNLGNSRHHYYQHALGSNTLPDISANGFLTQVVHATIHDDPKFVTIMFKPGGMFRLFGLALHEIRDAYINVADLIPQEAESMRERLIAADTNDEKVLLLDNFLLKYLKANEGVSLRNVDKACDMMIKTNGMMSISDIKKKLNMPSRTLEVHFQEKVGVSAKTYSRLIRFNHAIRLINTLGTNNWSDIVYQCGYFDQAHFIKEFQQYCGCTPSFYPEPNTNAHVHLLL